MNIFILMLINDELKIINKKNPIIIEITGVTGSGKSTTLLYLKDKIKTKLNIGYADQIINDECFNIIKKGKKSILRIVLLDFYIFFSEIDFNLLKVFFVFCKIILKTKQRFFMKINLFRNVLKRLCIYKKLQKIRNKCDYDIILVDEGTLHIVHNLFVDEKNKPELNKISFALSLMPLYDLTVLIEKSKNFLYQNALRNNHNRISKNNEAFFIDNSISVFSYVKALMKNKSFFKIITSDKLSIAASELNSFLEEKSIA